MENYYSFVYLDDDAINILYPQVFGDIVEKSVTQGTEENNGASVNANLFGILGSTIDSNEKGLSSESVKLVTTTPRKAQLLINHFQSKELNIRNIIKRNQPFTKSLCFVGKDIFFLSEIYNKNTGDNLFSNSYSDDSRRLTLDRDSVMILETGSTAFIKKYCSDYADTDDYYAMNAVSTSKYGIIMHMSNSKIKKDIHHLTSEIKRAKHFQFFVFGQLIKESDQIYRISPFAIWQ